MQTLSSSCFLALFFVAGSVYAQPSGGPYGPIDQRYEIPKAGKVYFVAPDGKTDATGADVAHPTTIEAAMERVVTGDAIVLRGGIYRTGGLVLNQGITIQPYEEEHPVLKGTKIATQWEALPNNVWRTHWSHLFPAEPLPWWNRKREGMDTPLHRFNNDMVFIDGELLISKGWEGELDRTFLFHRLQERITSTSALTPRIARWRSPPGTVRWSGPQRPRTASSRTEKDR